MADFCKTCSIRVFGEDMKDLAGLCQEDEMAQVLCEGCGYIWVDKDGKKIEETDGGKFG
jgi:hypothetical protein